MSNFTLYTDKNNDFRWKFIASNDQVVARSSEPYRTKEACISSLELLRKDIAGSTVNPEVEMTQSKGMPPRVAAPAPLPVPAARAVASTPAVAAPR